MVKLCRNVSYISMLLIKILKALFCMPTPSPDLKVFSDQSPFKAICLKPVAAGLIKSEYK